MNLFASVGSFKVLALFKTLRSFVCEHLHGQLDVRILASVFDIADDNVRKYKVKTEHDTYCKSVMHCCSV